jgi:hypothetical protein
LVIYLCLQPITYGAFAPEYPRVLSGIAYVLASASIVVNFTFGIWLLVPVRDTGGADLLY